MRASPATHACLLTTRIVCVAVFMGREVLARFGRFWHRVLKVTSPRQNKHFWGFGVLAVLALGVC